MFYSSGCNISIIAAWVNHYWASLGHAVSKFVLLEYMCHDVSSIDMGAVTCIRPCQLSFAPIALLAAAAKCRACSLCFSCHHNFAFWLFFVSACAWIICAIHVLHQSACFLICKYSCTAPFTFLWILLSLNCGGISEYVSNPVFAQCLRTVLHMVPPVFHFLTPFQYNIL